MKTDCMKEVGSVIILILERPLLSDDTIFPLLACNDDQIVRNLISVYCNNSHWLCIFIFQVLSGSMPLLLLFFCFGLVWFVFFILFSFRENQCRSLYSKTALYAQFGRCQSLKPLNFLCS